jgi:hypothetical protein
VSFEVMVICSCQSLFRPFPFAVVDVGYGLMKTFCMEVALTVTHLPMKFCPVIPSLLLLGWKHGCYLDKLINAELKIAGHITA